ncbi:MAG: DNA gyrase inhibitor YacG [Burkholderiales bacterium]
MAKIVPCPRCGKVVEWLSANPWRPFCSERCKLIDLGQWANEEYRIATEEKPGDDSGSTKN